MINIKITDKSGVKLLTKNKFCKEDINITLDESLVSGNPLELVSSDDMKTVLTSENIGKIYRYIGETNDEFTHGELYEVIEVAD